MLSDKKTSLSYKFKWWFQTKWNSKLQTRVTGSRIETFRDKWCICQNTIMTMLCGRHVGSEVLIRVKEHTYRYVYCLHRSKPIQMSYKRKMMDSDARLADINTLYIYIYRCMYLIWMVHHCLIHCMSPWWLCGQGTLLYDTSIMLFWIINIKWMFTKIIQFICLTKNDWVIKNRTVHIYTKY